MSSMFFSNLTLKDAVDEAFLLGLPLEFSSGIPYSEDNVDIFLKANIKRYLHNYFPAPKEPFVLNLASSNEVIRKKSIDHAKNGLKLAQTVNCGFYSIHAGFCLDPDATELGQLITSEGRLERNVYLDQFISSLQELLEYADLLKVDLLIENNVITKFNYDHHGTDPFLCTTPEEIIEVFNLIDHPRLKLLLDTGHLKVSSVTHGFDLIESFCSIEKYIGAIHHSDNDGLSDTNNPLAEGYWFLPFLKKLSHIPHILEVRASNEITINEQVELIKNGWRYI